MSECNKCKCQYIRETKRQLNDRFRDLNLNHHQLSNPTPVQTPVSLRFKASETGAEEERGGWGESAEGKGSFLSFPLAAALSTPATQPL